MSVKIIASMGPSSLKPSVFKQMQKKGLMIARLKSSFYTPESLDTTISMIRKNSSLKIMVDLEGCEIRVYGKKQKKIKKGQVFPVGEGKESEFYFNHDLYPKVKKGDIFVYDKEGAILCVQKKEDGKIFFSTDREIILRTGKGLNSGKKSFVIGELSKKDVELVDVLKKHKVEVAALSFTQSASEVHELRKLLSPQTKICAKIENHIALKNLASIVKAADIVVVARGDLSAEYGPEEIPRIQKKIIAECKKYKKPVVVASYIFTSMKTSKTPSTTEVIDVASIAEQGADMIWMDSPTAVGYYPIETIEIARKTLANATNGKNGH